jgi:hypothetical protein
MKHLTHEKKVIRLGWCWALAFLLRFKKRKNKPVCLLLALMLARQDFQIPAMAKKPYHLPKPQYKNKPCYFPNLITLSSIVSILDFPLGLHFDIILKSQKTATNPINS